VTKRAVSAGSPHDGDSPTPRRLRCYVASPLGFTEGGRSYYKTKYLPELATVVEPVDPWSLTSPAEIDEAFSKGLERELWLRVAARNSAAIRSSDVVAAYLEGQEADSGTVAEVGFAVGLGLPCFGLRSDMRLAGEVKMRLNLQVEGFIVQSGGAIFRSLDELVRALAEVRTAKS
jgi:nucleoside 2-deoxyribosyltransferase